MFAHLDLWSCTSEVSKWKKARHLNTPELLTTLCLLRQHEHLDARLLCQHEQLDASLLRQHEQLDVNLLRQHEQLDASLLRQHEQLDARNIQIVTNFKEMSVNGGICMFVFFFGRWWKNKKYIWYNYLKNNPKILSFYTGIFLFASNFMDRHFFICFFFNVFTASNNKKRRKKERKTKQ